MLVQRQQRRRTKRETKYFSESHHDILCSSSSSSLLSGNKIYSDGENSINSSSSSYNSTTTQTQNNMDNRRIFQFRTLPSTPNHHQRIEDDVNEKQNDLSAGLTFPTLWTKMATNEEAFPLQFEHQQHYQHNHHILLSPTLRSKEIAKGRQEMMEMIKNMPETSYELSLKDLITEQHQQQHPTPQTAGDDHLIMTADTTSSTIIPNEKRNKKIQVSRRKSMQNNQPFLLNMFFPAVSLESKKNNKKQSSRKGTTTCSKVSPRPPVLMEVEKKGAVDKECWKKRLSVAAGEKKNIIRSSDKISEEESSGSRNSSKESSVSRNSSKESNGRKPMGGFLPSCWSFYNIKIKSNKENRSIQF